MKNGESSSETDCSRHGPAQAVSRLGVEPFVGRQARPALGEATGLHWAGLRTPLLIATAFVLLNLVGLDRSPVVWYDEVTLNDPAKELALHGRFRSSVFAGSSGFESVYLWQPPGQPLVTALVYKLAGFGIWQTRVPVVLFGAGAIIALYFLSMTLFSSRRAAAVSAVLLCFDPKFIQSARSGRMDAQCLFLALLGCGLLFRAERDQTRRHIWLACSGACVGLAGATHAVAIVWAMVAGVILLFQNRGRLKALVTFGVSCATPPMLWLAYALRFPQFFRAQFVSLVREDVAAGSIWRRIPGELTRWGKAYQLVPLLLIAYVAGLIWVLTCSHYSRKTRFRVGVLFGVPFLFTSLVMVKNMGSWYLHPVTVLAVSAGAMVAALIPTPCKMATGGRNLLVTLALLSCFANTLMGGILARYVTMVYQWNARDYQCVERPISQIVPEGSVVWGQPEVWYAVERAGASLRLLGKPDPRLHAFAITEDGKNVQGIPGFHHIRDIGYSLPRVLGRFNPRSENYRMEIWQADKPLPPQLLHVVHPGLR
jgi:hypothetical protein